MQKNKWKCVEGRIGEAYQSFYAYEYAGVDPETGSEMFYINGEDGSRETTILPLPVTDCCSNSSNPMSFPK